MTTTKKTFAIVMLAAVFTGATGAANPLPTSSTDEALLARAHRILREVPLIDGHNDLPWQFRERTKNQLSKLDLRLDQSSLSPPLHTDVRRLRAGGVGGQFWSVYVPVSATGADAVRMVIEQIDVVHRLSSIYPDVFTTAYTAGDVRRIHKSGRVASLIGIEGGHSIGNSLAVLRQLYKMGARYMTLTHSTNVAWADSATDDPKAGGLTRFGEEVVREMNRLGMLVDLSHVSPAAMNDSLDVAVAPVIFSHSSARALTNHPRNVPDDVLKRLPGNGGIVMVTFVPSFITEAGRLRSAESTGVEARLKFLYRGEPERAKRELDEWKATHPEPRGAIADVADHIDHVRKNAGIDHVGIGGDLDGIESTPVGLESVADYPKLLAELFRRGYSDEDVRKVAGLNALRVMTAAEGVARKLQRERGASEALIEELDAKP